MSKHTVKFTPAPWRARRTMVLEKRRGKMAVALCPVADREHEEAVANARLIAVAPDMLDELEIVCKKCRAKKSNCPNCRINGIFKKVRGEK